MNPLPDYLDEQQLQLHSIFDSRIHKLVPLGNRQRSDLVALIDAEDAEHVLKLRWCLQSTKPSKNKVMYAASNGKKHRMHRYIIDPPNEISIDHVNDNGLDNRRCNLRFANNTQNNFNQGAIGGTSKYCGVTWHKQANKWQAQIGFEKSHIYLGLFSNEIEAAKAYDKAAKDLAGDFSQLNFPPQF